MDFTVISDGVKLAERWMRSECGVLRLPRAYFDIEITPTSDGADVVCMPYQSSGPRTRIASLY